MSQFSKPPYSTISSYESASVCRPNFSAAPRQGARVQGGVLAGPVCSTSWPQGGAGSWPAAVEQGQGAAVPAQPWAPSPLGQGNIRHPRRHGFLPVTLAHPWGGGAGTRYHSGLLLPSSWEC